MKRCSIIALIVLMFTSSIGFSQTFQEFITEIPVLTPQSNRSAFYDFVLSKPTEYRLPESLVRDWEGLNVNTSSFRDSYDLKLDTSYNCIGRYNLANNIYSLLMCRPNSDGADHYYLLNVFYNSVSYVPVSQLEVFDDTSNGGMINFAIDANNVVKVYNIGEEKAILTRFNINSDGHFILFESLTVDSNNDALDTW